MSSLPAGRVVLHVEGCAVLGLQEAAARLHSSEGASSATKKMLLKSGVLSGNKMDFFETISTCVQLCNMKTAVRMWPLHCFCNTVMFSCLNVVTLHVHVTLRA